AFDNVQVSVLTAGNLRNYTYSVSVYNTTGGLVASYQSEYAAAAFELPSGTYVFAATATEQQSLYYTPEVTNSGSAGVTASSGGGSSTAILCCVSGEPTVKSTDVCCVYNY